MLPESDTQRQASFDTWRPKTVKRPGEEPPAASGYRGSRRYEDQCRSLVSSAARAAPSAIRRQSSTRRPVSATSSSKVAESCFLSLLASAPVEAGALPAVDALADGSSTVADASAAGSGFVDGSATSAATLDRTLAGALAGSASTSSRPGRTTMVIQGAGTESSMRTASSWIR